MSGIQGQYPQGGYPQGQYPQGYQPPKSAGASAFQAAKAGVVAPNPSLSQQPAAQPQQPTSQPQQPAGQYPQQAQQPVQQSAAASKFKQAQLSDQAKGVVSVINMASGSVQSTQK